MDNRIYEEMLKGERAEYGAWILQTLSAKLIPQYGDRFSDRAYWRKLKQRLGAKGSKPVTLCHGLKLET